MIESRDHFQKYSIFRLALDVIDSISSYIKLLLHTSNDNSLHDIEQFYKKHRGNEDEVHIMDLTNNTYINILDHISQKPLKGSNILDIGCGSLTLYRYLNIKGIEFRKYYGIDSSLEKNESYSNFTNIKLIKGDVLDEKNYTSIMPDNIYIINTLSYIKSIDRLFAMIDNIAKSGDTLTIVEPYPSLFWEVFFDNIKMYYRKPNEIDNHLHKWKKTKSHVRYLYKFKSTYIWKVSYMSCYKRKL